MHRHEAVPAVDTEMLLSWEVPIRRQIAEAGLDLWDLELPRELKATRHEHLKPFFCFLLDGHIENDYGRTTIAFHPHLNVFHPAGTVHTSSAGRRGAHIITLEASQAWVDRVEAYAPLPLEPAAVPFEDGAWLGRRLLREIAAPQRCSPLVLEGIALELLAAAGRSPRSERSAPGWLARAIAQVHDRFTEPVRLSEVASDVDVPPARLSAEFRKYTGCTFGDYVRELRVGLVKTRLRAGDQPLAEIAFQAGFADQAHCTRVFKQATGWTPGQYRMALRSDATIVERCEGIRKPGRHAPLRATS